jgi:hypothetical protein
MQPVKTEKEKMLSGDLYVASDPILRADRSHATALLHQYNTTPLAAPAQQFGHRFSATTATTSASAAESSSTSTASCSMSPPSKSVITPR